MEGKKFSSSRGIVIYVKDILERYPVDAVRYYISMAGPETSDSDFTWSEFVRHNNEELAASWGNLVNRVANLIAKNFGEVPPVVESKLTDDDRALLAESAGAFATVGDLIEHHRQKNALNEAMRVVGDINKYISATEPWKIDLDRLALPWAHRFTEHIVASDHRVVERRVVEVLHLFDARQRREHGWRRVCAPPPPANVQLGCVRAHTQASCEQKSRTWYRPMAYIDTYQRCL